ncbi:alpha/beta hydrolase [Chitinophaga ginsengisegetis]|uniref:alpha/beta hydrolase n=1 Tax=Chitinophaga ginsengisegetis TaxID=393003 RepID=UPI000DBA6F00|nr:alpha/beta fold hydrolase [Chitinophaga ginsengisegetis]MDR6567534.1 pimeloyl-ACP methyl ester carboxylesterase [Chitinophaga ginsengisegetis]MDR6647911.1 pimeloyl-ACP methyl ester carboxylesterase [Chitinophaga ginsengisegetis]MDR6654261.1 pimeloyl-ACP methyl ester carboxylesterase [Chitinophaga ginsengisegetis]
MKKWYLLSFLCILFCTASAQQNDQITTQFFEQLGKGNWDGARENMDANMKTKVTPDMLKGIWQQLEQSYGKWEALISQKTAKEAAYDIILADNRFGKAILTFRVVFDNNHRIAGFFIAGTKLITTALLPYEETDTVTTTDGGILYGVLTKPVMKQPWPVVLIIAGSGPTDHNGNNPLSPATNGNSYQQLAAALAANGIASVRYDKRGIGQSTGFKKGSSATSLDDYTDDAIAWIDHLQKNTQQFKNVAVIGHSEGALIGLMAAGRRSFKSLVSLSGPGECMDKVLLAQLKPKLADSLYNDVTVILNELRQGNNPQQVPAALSMLFNPSLYTFWKSTFHYDPCALLPAVKMPFFIIGGTSDVQVPPVQADILHNCKPGSQLLMIKGMTHALKDTAPVPAGNQAPLPLSAQLVPSLVKFIMN